MRKVYTQESFSIQETLNQKNISDQAMQDQKKQDRKKNSAQENHGQKKNSDQENPKNHKKIPDQKFHRRLYEQYLAVRQETARDIEKAIEETLQHIPFRPTVKGRVKEFKSYYQKYLKGLKNNPDSALPYVKDLIGLRVVCPFFGDLTRVQNLLNERFRVIEAELKGSDYSFKEFGYESIHLLIKIPSEIIELRGDCGLEIAEIQIRTILQDAWAEVEHALVYKSDFSSLDVLIKRKLAAVNASLSLADTIFDEIRNFQQSLNGELGKRRNSFLKKIEETTDQMLYTPELAGSIALKHIIERNPEDAENADARDSIDELVLKALSSHNKNQFQEAVDYYTRILKKTPSDAIGSIIYKHRGMANFARSQYEDSIADFSRSLELDPTSHKAAYYRGVVKSVLQRYSEAIDDFTLSLTINPYYAFCFYRRGQAYYHLADLPQALADCEASLTLEPDLPELHRFKELLLNKLKM
ncbi:MAG: tetratricopeptide repeat protein [Spirochaetaceae bacterium]|jgi:putative GTP pyrophosphokinase|nr:tetratricopeptide repeat protein [Spirochaetaceae bacterium]